MRGYWGSDRDDSNEYLVVGLVDLDLLMRIRQWSFPDEASSGSFRRRSPGAKA